MAAVLDQYGVHGQTSGHSEVSLSGTYTAGTWYDVGINRAEITEGIYILRFYVDTFNSGAGSQYMCYTVSEPFFLAYISRFQQQLSKRYSYEQLVLRSRPQLIPKPQQYV